MIFREKSFIDRLCKMINHSLGHDNKENTRGQKPNEAEIQTNIESQALEYINNNLILVINLNNLHNYYQWVSLYPNLEKLCSTRFINETTKEKETFEGKAVSTLTDKSEVISACNFIENFIKESAKANLIIKNDDEILYPKRKASTDENIVFLIREDSCLKVKSGKRLEASVSTRLTNDKMLIFKHPECLNTYPQPEVISGEFYSEARFKNMIGTFNKLYNIIKGKLLRSRAFNQKYKDRCGRIIEIYQEKKLVKDSYNCPSNLRQQLANVASLDERIEELHAKIKEKEAISKLKMKIAKEAQENKKVIKAKIQESIDEKMEKLNKILSSLEK